MAESASRSDEESLAVAEGKSAQVGIAKEAGLHGDELLRLGYSLSHVVHAYGAMCQSITELATTKMFAISSPEFQELNGCLDVAIAGAVTSYQKGRNLREAHREVKHLGFLAHELRNTLTSVNVAFELIQRGAVGVGGNTGQIMARGLKRLQELIDRLYSAVSNLVQNAIKYSETGGHIQIRGKSVGLNAVIEIEDECGGLNATSAELFKSFAQKNDDRSGLGLGLSIVKRAVALNHGTVGARDLPGKGCVFTIEMPLVLAK